MNEDQAILSLYQIPYVGPATMLSLKDQFQTYDSALAHSPDQWSVPTHIKTSAKKFLETYSLDKCLTKLDQLKQSFITWEDQKYPNTLRNIPTPPPVLFYQGDISLLVSSSIAVVGTRNPTSYATRVITSIITPLISTYTIVSGFQRGVDQLAHQAALDAHGKTIAVLGTGLNIDYPANSNQIRKAVLDHQGLIVTEFPPDTPPEKGNFPRRNRIAAGLAQAVIVIEAALQSGSLVTAKHAVEQGKEVYAVPGSIFSRYSEGTHYLIKEGARIMTTAHDLMGGDRPHQATNGTPSPIKESLTGWKKDVFTFIAQTSPTLDECIDHFQRPISDILSALTEMELDGIIQKDEQGIYQVASV